MRLLIAAFGPFPGFDPNPAQMLIQRAGLNYVDLPVSYARLPEVLRALDPAAFDALMLVGVHGRARLMRLETRALNASRGRADADGVTRVGRIEPEGPSCRCGNLWSGMPPDPRTLIGTNAGAYLCNFAYYLALGMFTRHRVGFLHVPSPKRMAPRVQSQTLGVILAALGPLQIVSA